MLIIILLTILLMVGSTMLFVGKYTESDLIAIPGFLLMLIGCIGLATGLISIPCSLYQERKKIKDFEAMRVAYGAVNVKFSTDRSFIVMKVVEYNNWLRESKELKQGMWLNWYYPDEILTIKPIEL